MRFALIDNKKVEAQPKFHGLCPHCSEPVNAKCGTQKIWHWAHRTKTNCDNWWEPETEWHRTWKNNYPAEWQEIPMIDEKTGEKHIADVRTENKLVIEFQHSHIEPQERTKREMFYKNMVWVVDGTRLKRDYTRFLKGKKNKYLNTIFYDTDKKGINRIGVDFLDWFLPTEWIESNVPVIFDYWGNGTMDDPEGIRKRLQCLFPKVGKQAIIAEFTHETFVKFTKNGEWANRVQNFMDDLKKQDETERKNEIERKKQQQTMVKRIKYPLGSPLDRFIYKRRR